MLHGRLCVYMAEIQATSQAVLGIISNQQWRGGAKTDLYLKQVYYYTAPA
jgi:hypothetical protein